MSIAQLKERLRDVPGIEGLTMQSLLGRQVFGFDGKIAAVDPNASDQEIETAIRNTAATAERPLEPIAAALADMLSPVTPLPPVNITEPKPMTNTGGYKSGSIGSVFKALRERGAKITDDAQANAAKLTAAFDAAEKVNAGMASDADALMAELGQITNFPPE